MKQLVKSNELLNFTKELLEEGKKATFTITGNSMRPFYKSKATSVTITSVKDISLKKYDVVLYKANSQYLLHRIVKINDDNLIIMGDGLRLKEFVEKEKIIGVVIEHEHNQKKYLKDDSSYLFRVKLWYHFRFLRRMLLKVFK